MAEKKLDSNVNAPANAINAIANSQINSDFFFMTMVYAIIYLAWYLCTCYEGIVALTFSLEIGVD